MEPPAQRADLFRLFGGRRPEAVRSARAVAETATAPAELARQALKTYEQALELQRQGNWTGYGERIKNLEEILRRLAK